MADRQTALATGSALAALVALVFAVPAVAAPAGVTAAPACNGGPGVRGLPSDAFPCAGPVLLKRPRSSRFQRLAAKRAIPFGSTIDAREGSVRLTARGRTGTFAGAVFKLAAAPNRRANITLRLTGTLGCRSATDSRRKRKSQRRRGLWSDAHGGFRTEGEWAAATALGTRWLTEDGCAGTLVSVARGKVSVADLRTREQAVVTAGRSYFASGPASADFAPGKDISSWRAGPSASVSVVPSDATCQTLLSPLFSGDNQLLFYVDCRLTVTRVDMATGALSSEAPLPLDPATSSYNDTLSSVSTTGRFLTVRFDRNVPAPPGSSETWFNRDVYRLDTVSNTWTQADVAPGSESPGCPARSWVGGATNAVSDDGRFVSLQTCEPLDAGDSEYDLDTYVHNFEGGANERVSSSPSCQNGSEGGVDMSADGRYVAFDRCVNTNQSCNGPHVLLRDRATGATTRLTNECGSVLDLSPDGRFVLIFAFGRLVVLDRLERTASRLSVDQGNGNVLHAVISDDGRFVGYSGGFADGQVAQIYRLDRETGEQSRVRVAADGSPDTCYEFAVWDMTADGRRFAFQSCGRLDASVPDDRYYRLWFARFG